MKPTVVYPLVATVFLIFFTISRVPNAGTSGRYGRRMVDRHVAFDPMIEDIRSHAEGGGLRNQAAIHDYSGSPAGLASESSDEYYDMEEFFSEEGQFNITERLIFLFPLVDMWPQDGRVSFEELEYWNVGQANERLGRMTDRELKAHDKDGDGAITLYEYLYHLSNPDMETDYMLPGQAGWWKERFMSADLDDNGSLDHNEFKDFLHPEDSCSRKMRLWLQNDKIREMDQDGDGKLNFAEFLERAYPIYKSSMEFENDHLEDPIHIPDSEEKFAILDVNKDRHLSGEEMEPIMKYISPGELSYASHFTKYLMRESDDDKDGKLSLSEMLNHEHIFYGSFDDESNFEDINDEL